MVNLIMIYFCQVNRTTKHGHQTDHPNIVNPGVDIDSGRWAKSLFTRMNFVKGRKTSWKVDIPEGPRKEIEYLFLHDIVSKVKEYNIPSSLIVNIDQTPIKFVPVGSESLA